MVAPRKTSMDFSRGDAGDNVDDDEVLGILFSADQNTVTQWWTELTAGQ